VFILYAVVLGVLVGLASGGRLAGLADLRFRWSGLIMGGLAVQVILFSGPVVERVGGWGAPIYVLSTAAVLVALIRNLAITGLPIVAVGAAGNLAAIVANGGFMPASPDALASFGRATIEGYSNSAVVARPALEPFTDLFALPRFLPFANVFSVGDLLIGLGIAVAIVWAMRQEPRIERCAAIEGL
jgi:hypothetical protein